MEIFRNIDKVSPIKSNHRFQCVPKRYFSVGIIVFRKRFRLLISLGFGYKF